MIELKKIQQILRQ